MELPKNITQIGETNRNCKIYVEDYVISYIKQVNQLALNKEMAVALYGIRKTEGNVMYLFIYGACKLDFLHKETRHLSQAQCQEIEKLRRKYFPDYEFQGYRLLNGEMVEGFHICEQEICRYITGYAQFYEKNDSMLAYMLDMRSEEAEPEFVDREKYEMVKRRQEERRAQYGEYRDSGFRNVESSENDRETESQEAEANMSYGGTVRESTGNAGGRVGRAGRKHEAVKAGVNADKTATSGSLRKMRMSTVAVFAVLCVLGVGALGQGKSLEEWKEAAKQALNSLTEQKLPDAQVAGSQNVVSTNTNEQLPQMNAVQNIQNSTLIAEDKLAEALQAENVATGSSSNGQAVNSVPQQAETSQGGGTEQQSGTSQVGTAEGQTVASPVGVTEQQSGTPQTGASEQQSGVSQTGTTSQQTSTSGQQSASTSQQTDALEQPADTVEPQAGAAQSAVVSPQQDTPDQQAAAGQQTETAQTTAQPINYTIKEGDTLIAISVRNYGTDARVSEICSLNQISNPDDIKVGQKILLP